MSLAPGARLGPYEVLSAIGAGGMGGVYRARDTRLDREVAVRILPDLFATDADRVMRFEREARLLAALNHPNIAESYHKRWHPDRWRRPPRQPVKFRDEAARSFRLS
jgi:serine/threonine protein kinase